MDIVLKIVKWAFGILMALILVVGVIDLVGTKIVSQVLPTGPDDLGAVELTVKTLDEMPKGFVLTADQYPSRFVIVLVPPPKDLKALVQPGHKVNVLLKKEEVNNLQNVPVIQIYSLTLEDGKKIFDTSQTIPRNPDLGTQKAQRLFYRMIWIPTLYFLALVLFPRTCGCWRKDKANQANGPTK